MKPAYLSTIPLAIAVCVSSVIWSVASAKSAPDRLVILNWSDYLDPKLIEKFEQQFGVKIYEVYFASDEMRNDMMLETDGVGYDIVIVDEVIVELYQKRGWLAPLDMEKVPNLKHIDRYWLDEFTRATGYAVPYFWGTMGIAYRKDLIEIPLTRWMDLLQPDESLRAKIGMTESAASAFSVALKALGYSANDTDPKAFNKAKQLLLAQRPYVKTYKHLGVTKESALVTGDVAACMFYNGDALIVQKFNEEIDYVVPEEGALLWVDYLVVLESSNQKRLAWEFVNFLNEPANAAQLAQYVNYASPNKAAEKLLPADFLADEAIYPSEAILAKSEFYQSAGARWERKLQTAFAGITQ